MRILLAGASGLLGRALIEPLVAGGHAVTGTTRKPDRLAAIADAGATGALMDALNPDSVEAAVAASRPDVIIQQLTDLASSDFAANARLRIEGTSNLVAAARRHGVQRIVAQSIAWAYAPAPGLAAEDAPFAADPATGTSAFAAIEELERSVSEIPSSVVLRYGLLYGPGTWYARGGEQWQAARRGDMAATSAWTSFLHVADAVSATVAALSWPDGPVNVVDNEPVHVRDWGPAYVAAAGGPAGVTPAARAEGRGASNALARSRDWAPSRPSWRTELLASP